MGTAYAIWGGIGALGTLLVGIAFYQPPLGWARIALVIGLIGCIIGLKLVSAECRAPAALLRSRCFLDFRQRDPLGHDLPRLGGAAPTPDLPPPPGHPIHENGRDQFRIQVTNAQTV